MMIRHGNTVSALAVDLSESSVAVAVAVVVAPVSSENPVSGLHCCVEQPAVPHDLNSASRADFVTDAHAGTFATHAAYVAKQGHVAVAPPKALETVHLSRLSAQRKMSEVLQVGGARHCNEEHPTLMQVWKIVSLPSSQPKVPAQE
jgi:hypothetical protein